MKTQQVEQAATGLSRFRLRRRGQKGKEEEPGGRGRRTVRLLVGSLVVLIVGFAVLVRFAYVAPSPGRAVTLDDFYLLVGENRLKDLTFLDQDSVVVGHTCLAPPLSLERPAGAPGAADQGAADEAAAGQGAPADEGAAGQGAPADEAAAGQGAPADEGAAGQGAPADEGATGQGAGERVGGGAAGRPQASALLAERPRQCYDPITRPFHTAYPASQVETPQLIATVSAFSGAEIVVDRQTEKAVAKVLATFLFPLLMLANLFGLIFLARSGDGSLGEIAGFGRMGRKGQKKDHPGSGVTFADVAGAEEAVAELREVIDYLKDPERFAAYGAAPPKGVLLFGPPGCGKTLLARATAGESGVAFFSTSGTEFVESLVGIGAARVRDLFRQVREAAPAILFIDEIDAVGRRRSGEGTSGGEREQTLNQLLVELDGFEVTSGIVLMGATNRPDILDPALMRPGRFDRHITLEPPDVHGRLSILELHARGRPIGDDVDFGGLARRTPGFTGADLANVVNEAALLAIRQAPGTPISTAQLNEAIMRVLHGPQRRGKLITGDERRRLAIHEGGHAVVSAALGHGDEVHRVSIVARAKGLAQVAASGDGDRALLTAGQLQARLAIALAGVAAEVLVLGESSTAAQDDIARATVLAQEMVGLHGMSTHLGRVRLLTVGDSYLGAERSIDMVSGPTMAEFDAEVRRLIAAAENAAASIIASRQALLDEMVEVLLETETLEGAELSAFLVRVELEPRPGANGRVTAPARAQPAARTRRPVLSSRPRRDQP